MLKTRISVLLIDAFPDEGEMYAEYLATCGCATEVCCDAHVAIEHATRNAPDIVVTRLRQSGPLTGIDIVARLKAHDATRHVPVVMITTSMSAADRDAALQAGCDGYMLLPTLPDDLFAELRRVLATRALDQMRPTPVTARPKTSAPDRRRA